MFRTRVVLLAFTLTFPAALAQNIAKEAIRIGHWTKAEERDYKACVVRLAATQDPSDKSDPGSWCEVYEEHAHWMHAHPQLAVKKEIPGQFSKCNHAHATEMSGPPEQFYAAFDLCVRKAYGLNTKN